MRWSADRQSFSVLLCLFAILGSLSVSPAKAGATSLPSFNRSGDLLMVAEPFIISQFELGRSSIMISYPQDQEQQFRFRVSLLQLMEVTPPNKTSASQVVGSVSLASVNWEFTQLGNASEVRFGPNLQGKISATVSIQRGANAYSVNISLVFFASLKENDTTVVTNDWVAIEPVGGPTRTKLDLSISGWPFQTATDALVLSILLDGSQGTVSHHGEFTATELFNTIAMVNDVTQKQDASIQWLRRAVIDNGTRTSADVTLNTLSTGENLYVDLYYPSFTVATLTHDFLLETSSSFKAAGFVPLQFLTPIAGAATLFVLTLSITYLSRRQQFVLRRNR